MIKIGMTGSLAHVLTNNKIKDKGACLKEMTVEGIKDTVKIGATTAVVGGAAAGGVALANKLATSNNAKVAEYAKQAIDTVSSNVGTLKNEGGKLLSKVSIEGKSLKDIVKNSDLYTKFKALPTPAKAAIAAGTAALAVIAPLFAINSASKAGHIEGKHEEKIQMQCIV